MRVTVDDGVGIEVEVTGSGPPLVLVHGFTGAKEDFADHVARLGEHSSVVTFDHRGHGESDKPGEITAYSFVRLALDTLAVADALGLERFRLLGHSMGGMVARRVVLSRPERIEALVLMDTSPGPPSGIDPVLSDGAAELALTQGMAVLRAVLDEVDPFGTEADRRVRAERPGYEEMNRRKWDAVPAVAYAALLREIVHQPAQLEAMRTITCPTLVIVGEQDEPFLDDSRAMAEATPGAELVVITDAGHAPQFENPTAWYGVLDAFLQALPAEAVA
jgi:pimeloyl-ACP methyl ester carboxylesterase